MNQLRLERDKLEKEKAINSVFRDPKSPRANPLNLTAEKLKEKLTINEELFMEQIQLLENDNSYLRKEL